MRQKFLTGIGLTSGSALSAPTGVYGATANQEFYNGKVIRIIVGFSAGGGFDTYARSLSRYMGKYIPGNPTIIVENMPGAGSLISANYIYRVAKADGLTIGAFNGNQILGQLVGGQGVSFDPRKMEWLGAPGYNHDSVYSIKRPASPTRSNGSPRRRRCVWAAARRSDDRRYRKNSQGGDQFTDALNYRLQGHGGYSRRR